MKTHPVQIPRNFGSGKIRTEVTLRAYEVYSHVWSPQEAMITGNCRGGFSTGELIVFLYAHSFPKDEWKIRVKEGFEGLEKL